MLIAVRFKPFSYAYRYHPARLMGTFCFSVNSTPVGSGLIGSASNPYPIVSNPLGILNPIKVFQERQGILP